MPSASAAGMPTPRPILAANGKPSEDVDDEDADELDWVAELGTFVGSLVDGSLGGWLDAALAKGLAVGDVLGFPLDTALDALPGDCDEDDVDGVMTRSSMLK